MSLINERIRLSVNDTTHMDAYVARPSGSGPFPAMLVFQEALGVNSQLRGVADRFAEEGFIAIAPDLFHRTNPGYEASELDPKVIMPMVRTLTPEGLIADATAAHMWLTNQTVVDSSRIAAMGFCMGGRTAYLANSELPLAAGISYYGGYIAPGLLDRAARLSGPHLFFWGGMDPSIPVDQRRAVIDAMAAAGKKFVSVEFSDANHAFFNEQASLYNPAAARQSWALAIEFLKEHLVTS